MKNEELRIKSILVLIGGIFARYGGIKKIICAIGYYLIAGVLLFSGISKIIDPMPLIETLKLVVNLPEKFLITIGAILPILEITLGIALIIKIKVKLVLIVTLVLFVVFFLFSVYGTMMGLKNDCGCFGSIVTSEIGWGMIVRNLIITLINIIIVKKP